METQQQQTDTDADARPMAEWTLEEIADAIAEAKMKEAQARRAYDELKDEFLSRTTHKQRVAVEARAVIVNGEEVRPISSIEVIHKVRETVTVPEKEAIRLIRAADINSTHYIEVVTEERLDRKALLRDVWDLEELEPISKLVKVHRTDFVEVRGLPK